MKRPAISPWTMPPRTLRLVLAAVAIAVIVIALFDVGSVLRACLAALLLALAIPTGALVLLLIHALTGGRWGEAAGPALRAAAGVLPFAALLALPVLVGQPQVFAWARDPSLIAHADVARWYLNAPGMALRTVVTLLLWSGFAALAAWRPDRLSQPLAGVGLLVFGLSISFASIDWVLALDPRFRSTAFAMSLSISWLLAAAAFIGIARPAAETADWAKLTATFALGLVYLDFMQFIVGYTGNLPDIAAWYLRRDGPVEIAAVAVAFIGANLVPFLAVLADRWRRSSALRAVVGACALVGLAARTLWLVVPEWPAGILFWLALPLVIFLPLALAAMTTEQLARQAGRRLEAEEALAHGA